MSEQKESNINRALALLIEYYNSVRLCKEIEYTSSVDMNIKTEMVSASARKLNSYTTFCSSLEDETEQRNCLNLISKYQMDNVLTSSIGSFEQLTDKQKRDKDFLMVCLRSGVDGRILSHVNPFILFTSSPDDEDNFVDWYETAELDDQFIGEAVKINEHCFFGIVNNDQIQTKIDDGYTKFEIWSDENAWVNALQNSKFLKYHDDLSLDALIDEMAGTPIEQTFNETIATVKSDLNAFASSIIHDYFRLFLSLQEAEKEYDIKVDEQYFNAVANNQTAEPTLRNHAQSQEIYHCTKLGRFEAIIKFIYAH